MYRLFLAFLLLLLLLLPSSSQAQEAPQSLPPISVYFSPDGGCKDAIVKEIRAAKTDILVQAYIFTSAPIAKALVEAHKRGVKIEVILDKSQRTEKYSEADFLVNMGISTYIDAKHAIAHNKIMVIDSQVVITGSFNFTKAAEEKNAENLLVIRDNGLAEKYTANWKAHAEHSEKYQAKEKGYSETVRPTEKTEGGYTASVNSQVFHKPDCKSAAKSFAKNIIRYATRDEAIQAGKKPCAECEP